MTARPRRANRLVALLLLVLAAAAATVLGTAAPAAAHAELISSTPQNAARLDAAPREIALQFSESVTLVPSALRMLDAEGASAVLGDAGVEGNMLRVAVPGPLADGGYVFVYRVISGDSHPVSGALTFTVGTGAAVETAAVGTALSSDDDAAVAALAGINRWLGYAGVVLLIGVPAFVAACRRAAARDPVLRALVLIGAGLVALTALASLPLQAARTFQSGLADGLERDALATILDTAYGDAALARLAFVALLLGALWTAVRFWAVRALVLAGFAAGAVLLTFARSGHPAVGDYPAATMLLDVVHFGAVAVWLGGLVVLAVRLLPAPPPDCRETLARWSAVAMAAVAVLAVTGSAQAWRELRSFEALVDTTYGRWILVKAGGLLLLLAAAEYGRRRVRTLAPARPVMSPSLGAARADTEPAETARLRRSVGLELALAAAVLAATSALVVTTPGAEGTAHATAEHAAGSTGGHADGGHTDGHTDGHTEEAPATKEAGPRSAGIELPNDVRIELAADPATAGAAQLTLTVLSLTGEPVDPPEITVTAALPERGIAPITLTAQRTDTGRYTVDGTSLILAGLWKFTVTVRTTDVDAGVGSVEIALS